MLGLAAYPLCCRVAGKTAQSANAFHEFYGSYEIESTGGLVLGEGHLGSANSQSVLKTAYIKWILDSCLQGKSVVSQVAEAYDAHEPRADSEFQIGHPRQQPSIGKTVWAW
jgi:hypothetical protein